ncbi:hypothetical protein SAMN05920897_105141 [Alkalispirochaeta americana]|uniref:Uncharacterized protein n=1 Tax=Alkalispirochaeta americana TaxID=159291 RepID=A0A1N6R2U7_9SPIO|nr:hypothetical protein SAMN05920897_105141 [Alkalispirochaeta americana]
MPVKWNQRRAVALEYLRKIYRYDPETASYTIDVRLPDYSYAFSQWAHPWEEVPEVNPGLVQYLKECSDDIPYEAPLQIVFGIEGPRGQAMERELSISIRKYFRYELFIERRRLRRLWQRALHYMAISVVFLIAGTLLGPETGDHLVRLTLRQGLNVGGWVFMWEAIHQITFQQQNLRRTIADYTRFLDARISFERSEL